MPASNSEARKRREEREQAVGLLLEQFGGARVVSTPLTTMPDAWRGVDPS